MGEIDKCDEEMPKFLNFIACVVERVAERNDVKSRSKISIFDGLSRPAISVQSYLERIFKYANCSPSCFIVAYIYLDRFSQMQPLLPINSFNVHRLLITSVLVSAKFMDDIFYNNGYYGKVGGISTREMNLLEVDFLFGIGFQLNVTPTTFHTYCSYLHTEMLMLEIPMPLKIVNQQYCCVNDDESSTHELDVSQIIQKILD